MSRSGYTDDFDPSEWNSICWRGAVASAIRSQRGQAFLREMLAALDAIPEKRLIAGVLENRGGGVCAMGAVGRARGTDLRSIDPEDLEAVAAAFGIAPALAAEIAWANDEATNDEAIAWRIMEETPETRFARVRAWVALQIRSEDKT